MQAASAKLFGFSPLSLLLPEAIISTSRSRCSTASLARRLGAAAGLAGALALAVFPSFVAVSRDNGVDPLLLLLMILACGAALNAIEDGRWRWLMACAVLVGLAFNTKTLAAYLIVPGIALAYLLCAPGPLVSTVGMLAVAGVVMGSCRSRGSPLVELTPASQRPYRRQLHQQHRARVDVRIQRLRARRRRAWRTGKIPVAEGGARPHPGRSIIPVA